MRTFYRSHRIRALAQASRRRSTRYPPSSALAVELARRERPDVVLMDVRMPQMDGIEPTLHICGSPDTVGCAS